MSVDVFFIWNAIISDPQVLLLKGWRLRAAFVTDRVTKALTCARLARLKKDACGQEQMSMVRLCFQNQGVRERLYSVVAFALIAIPNT